MTVTKSQLDKMLLKNKHTLTLTSRYDSRRAGIIIANKELVMNALAVSGSSRSKCKEGDHLWSMLEWQARYGKMEGSMIKYDMAKGADYGRLYPTKSVHGYVQITRSVRHYLARNIYTDIDIDNCHPVLIEQLFPLIVQRESPSIKYWNSNRSELFSRMQEEAKLSGISLTRDQCKEVGFIFLYGGNMAKEFEKLGLAKKGHVWTLCDNLCKDMLLFTTRFADVYRDVFDSLGSLRNAAKLSIIMQHIERHLALVMVKVAESLNIEVGDVCHDGLFISLNGSPVSPDICDEFMERSIEAIKKDTGFSVNLSIKEMANPGWISELKVQVLSDDDYVINSDDEASEKFMNKFRGRLFYGVDGWYIRPLNSYFWLCGDYNVKAEIMKCNYLMKRSSDKVSVYSANTTGCNAIFAALCNKKEILVDETFINRVNESIIGMIHWEDKHLHGETQKFYDNEPNLGLGAFLHLDGKAPVDEFNSLTEDDEIYKTMVSRCFSMLEPQQLIDLFRCLSRGLYGHVEDKVWFVIDSSRDGGKSTITRSMCGAFGEYITDGVRAPTVGIHSNDSSKNAWMLTRQLHKRRISWSQEVATTMKVNGGSAQVPLDGNLIKKIASGGDPIDVRALYGGETSVKYNAMMFLNVNGLPVTDPKDAIKTAIPFTIMKEYTTDPEKLAMGGIYTPADQKAVDLMSRSDYKIRLQWAILKLHYSSTRVCIANLPSTQADYFDITDSVVTPEFKLFKERIIVPKEEDRVPIPSDDIMELFRLVGIEWSKNRIFKFLKSQIRGLESGNRSVNRKSVHCYIGLLIRPIVTDDDDQMDLQI